MVTIDFEEAFYSLDHKFRGVGQGGPLFPLLFILCLEVMACSIHENDKIQGIKIKNEEVKLSLFAHDMTCF